MSSATVLNRRDFLKAALKTSAAVAVPLIVPGAVLGKDGGVAPSERITLGAIGIGNRGSYVLGCFLQQPDVRFVAIAEVKQERRDRTVQQRHVLFLLQNDGQLKHLADIVEPTDRTAEALLVLRDDPEFYVVLLMFDGVANGGPLQYFVPR